MTGIFDVSIALMLSSHGFVRRASVSILNEHWRPSGPPPMQHTRSRSLVGMHSPVMNDPYGYISAPGSTLDTTSATRFIMKLKSLLFCSIVCTRPFAYRVISSLSSQCWSLNLNTSNVALNPPGLGNPRPLLPFMLGLIFDDDGVDGAADITII